LDAHHIFIEKSMIFRRTMAGNKGITATDPDEHTVKHLMRGSFEGA
jgi:hypothetical protein